MFLEPFKHGTACAGQCLSNISVEQVFVRLWIRDALKERQAQAGWIPMCMLQGHLAHTVQLHQPRFKQLCHEEAQHLESRAHQLEGAVVVSRQTRKT